MAKPFRASYGGVDLLVVSATGEDGRDWVEHSPSRGDTHVLQDRGRRLSKLHCELEFLDEPGATGGDYLERYRAFRDLARGGPQMFTNPLDGSYPAIVQGFEPAVDADNACVKVRATFVALDEARAVFPIGAGVSPAAGPEEVGVTVERANEQLAAAGLSSSIPSDALATVESWATAADPDSRAILLELGTLAGQIDTAIAALELATSYERWDLYKSFVTLRYQIARAAETVTAETADVLDYTLRTAMPLRVLTQRIYGAAAAEERAVQIAKLNGIRRPGMLAAGTTIKIPATTGAAR